MFSVRATVRHSQSVSFWLGVLQKRVSSLDPLANIRSGAGGGGGEGHDLGIEFEETAFPPEENRYAVISSGGRDC